jgi:outer membrane protein assembly factor BamB
VINPLGNGQPNCRRIGVKREEKDGKVTWEAKETGKGVAVGNMQQYCTLDATENSILVCEFNRVAEYDLTTGKELWKHNGTNPMSCQRLPNGNTLIAFSGQGPGGKLVEVDAAGEVLWEYESKDGLRVAKAYRR